jgi:excinuclease ABC subunit A
VGTVTDIYTDPRMVYEKLGVRTCPYCGETISAADCREETEKAGDEFTVFMYCHRCGQRMEKLTRTHFSHNTREGACPTCQGLGQVLTVNKQRVVDESLSLEEGAVAFWEQKYGEWLTGALYSAFRHYGIPVPERLPIKDFTPLQRDVLFYGLDSKLLKEAFPDVKLPKTVTAGRFEGVVNMLMRRMADQGGDAKQLNEYFISETCPDCRGERLGPLSCSVTVAGTRLPELADLPLEALREWVRMLDGTLTAPHRNLVQMYLLDLETKIKRIINVGLGYLTLDRQTSTLSGGESQRVRLAATLDSDLMGMVYILDEPTIGLHPHDTTGMIAILKKLRDLGNTVLVIEHDPDVMAAADYVVDMGPGAGRHGGEVIAAGTLERLMENPASVTGAYLRASHASKQQFRTGDGGAIKVEHANLHNLRNIDVSFPTGRLVAVTGVSGSGKSTLVFDVLAAGGVKGKSDENIVRGLDAFDQIITIEQATITRMRRSNVATYSEVYSEIRELFGGLEEAKRRGLSAKHFSFNTKGGRCENCEGLGYVSSHLLFFQDIEVTCPVCGGKQFSDEVLAVKYHGHSIKDILRLSVEEALPVFAGHHKIERILSLLQDVGLGYLELGQSLTTLSGGEGQRLKLAKELVNSRGQKNLYLMDEPTTGLHPVDVENFLVLLNRLVDAGNTVITVEHNQQLIMAADWVIDLGPGGGTDGGQVVFEGTPDDLLQHGHTATAECLRASALCLPH